MYNLPTDDPSSLEHIKTHYFVCNRDYKQITKSYRDDCTALSRMLTQKDVYLSRATVQGISPILL
jgi:hypothetical protein